MQKIFVILISSLTVLIPTGSSACTSDYSCGVGYACVKEPYKTRGECMKTVNEYGLQTFELPRNSSVGPRMSGDSCTFVTDCPIGFSCDRELRVCIK